MLTECGDWLGSVVDGRATRMCRSVMASVYNNINHICNEVNAKTQTSSINTVPKHTGMWLTPALAPKHKFEWHKVAIASKHRFLICVSCTGII
jgi:hypothetical protein